VDKSLVQAQPESDRFRLHETMRAYMGAALDAEGLTAVVRDRRLDYFTQFATKMLATYWAHSVTSATCGLEPDIDNLRTALDWSIESKQFNAGAKLIWASGQFFSNLGLLAENVRRCERLLSGDLDTIRRAEVLHYAAICSSGSDPPSSLRFASELTELGRSVGDERTLAFGLSAVAATQMFTAPEAAIAAADEAIPIATKAAQFLVMPTLCYKSAACRWLGRLGDALCFAEQAVRAAGEPHARLFARATVALAAVHVGRLADALEHAGAALELGTDLSDPLFVMLGEIIRGQVYTYQGEAGAAEAFERAHAAAEVLGDVRTLAMIEAYHGDLKARQGQLGAGYDLLEAATAKGEAIGQYWTGNSRALLAALSLKSGDLAAARRHIASASGHDRSSSRAWEGALLGAEARLARAEGELRHSHGLACDGLEIAFSNRALLLGIDLLELVAMTKSELGRSAEAARLLGAAELQRDRTGYARSVLANEELAPVQKEIQRTLGREAGQVARADGYALTFEDAVRYAGRGRGRHARAVFGWDSLTPTERRVAALVAERLTNAEIAQQLFVSTATVKSHLTRVFAKLGVSGRRELAIATQREVESPTRRTRVRQGRRQ
jgi:DNA-binding CsgD family transcriptional regulator